MLPTPSPDQKLVSVSSETNYNQKPQFVPEYSFNVKNKLISKEYIEGLVNFHLNRKRFLIQKLNQLNQKFCQGKDLIKFVNMESLLPCFKVNDIEIYRRAFTHKAFIKEQQEIADKMDEYIQYKNSQVYDKRYGEEFDTTIQQGMDTIGYIPTNSNERAEYRGDGTLKGIHGSYLYKRFQGKTDTHDNEGFLTNMRIKLEKKECLSQLSIDLGLDQFLLLPTYLENSAKNGRSNKNALENIFEAFIGSIMDDHPVGLNYLFAYYFVSSVMETHLDFETLVYKNDNFKSPFVQWISQNKLGEFFIGKSPFIDICKSHSRFVTCILVKREYLELNKDKKVKGVSIATKIKQYNLKMEGFSRGNNENGIVTKEEFVKIKQLEVENGAVCIGIGKDNKRIGAHQNSAKEAMMNLGIPLNYN